MDHPPGAATVPLGTALREEVGRLRERETRRAFDTAVHLGILGGPRTTFVARAQDLPVLDAGLRTEVVCRLLDDTPDGHRCVWLTRAGEPQLHDVDLDWLSAATLAFATRARPLCCFYAVTRTGWLDVRGGRSRSWKRLRLS